MTEEVAVYNPFTNAPVAARPSAEASARTDGQRAIAEVQAALIVARANPRDPIAATERILNACMRPGLAERAVYQYARGGTNISGPSIRLAEAMAQAWGNIESGIVELSRQAGVSEVMSYAWDLETNRRERKVFHVPHVRDTKSGRKPLTDERDIYELIANQSARRLRACILAVIPGDVTEVAVAQCEATMKAKADTGPEAMKKMAEAFAAFGVSKEQIETRIQRRLDAIQPAQVVNLKKIYASLRDGMSAAADWFEPVAAGENKDTPATGVAGVKAALRKRNEPSAPAPESAPSADLDPGHAEFLRQMDDA